MTDWDSIICHVIAATGMSWQTVLDEIDLPRLEALNRYWKDFPPVHVMVRRAMKIESTPQSEANDDEEMTGFMSAFPQH